MLSAIMDNPVADLAIPIRDQQIKVNTKMATISTAVVVTRTDEEETISIVKETVRDTTITKVGVVVVRPEIVIPLTLILTETLMGWDMDSHKM